MTVTAPSVLTVPAPKIMAGDVIDSRRVRSVGGRRARTVSNAESDHSGTGQRFRRVIPASTFSGHVVHQLWTVRENCRDAVMYDALTEAMLETQRALGRLARISQEARDA